MLDSRRQGPAGGPGSTPRNPRQHGQRLRRELDRAIERARPIRVVEGVDPGLVFKVQAKGRITDDTWTARGLAFLGETGDWTYFVLSREDAPDQLLEQLSNYAAGPDLEGAKAPLRTFFNAVENIQPYGPEDRRGPGLPEDLAGLTEPIVVDAAAWPSPSREEAERRLRNLRAVVERYDGEEFAHDARPRFTLLRARLSGEGVLALLEQAVVERIRTPPTPYLEPSDWMARGLEDLEYRFEDGEPIGVIDDAIAAHPLLDGTVRSRRSFPASHSWAQPSRHGTMVAGLAAYGEFETPLREGLPLVARGPLHQARVLEPNPDWPERTRFAPMVTAHQAVEQAIETLHRDEGVRVFNLSITDPDPYSGPHVSLFTERLDELIRELGIVVVVPAGNQRANLAQGTMASGADVLAGYPDYALDPAARLAEPAPAALALTVGSLARFDAPQTPSGQARVGDQAIAAAEQLSPFSRTGPGAFKGVKPEVVEYGGNWVLNDVGRLETENVGVGVISLGVNASGRLFTVSSGTSFAAPRVARLAADLWSAYPDASANLIRALIAMAGRTPGPLTAQFADADGRLRAAGFGRPIPELAAACGGARAVMYFDGSLRTDTAVIHPVPIPERFARGAAGRRISVSLAFDPPVRRQRREYLAGKMTFDLLRNVDERQVRERYQRQGAQRVDLFSAPRRIQLEPGVQASENSALQVRQFRPRQLDPDDGDVYYVVVTHRSAPWAEEGDQGYSLVVELVEEERVQVDLYAEVQQQVRLPARLRVRR
jgi:hypothetical protein